MCKNHFWTSEVMLKIIKALRKRTLAFKKNITSKTYCEKTIRTRSVKFDNKVLPGYYKQLL
jgi:hypothetical protein